MTVGPCGACDGGVAVGDATCGNASGDDTDAMVGGDGANVDAGSGGGSSLAHAPRLFRATARLSLDSRVTAMASTVITASATMPDITATVSRLRLPTCASDVTASGELASGMTMGASGEANGACGDELGATGMRGAEMGGSGGRAGVDEVGASDTWGALDARCTFGGSGGRGAVGTAWAIPFVPEGDGGADDRRMPIVAT